MENLMKNSFYKTLANSTLERKTKKELIGIIRALEQNWVEAENCIDNQERAMKTLLADARKEYEERLATLKTEYQAQLRFREKEWTDKYVKLSQEKAHQVQQEEFYTLEQMQDMSPNFIERNWEKVSRSLAKLAADEKIISVEDYEG